MKLMKILVAALVMAAMVTPAIAEDRLKLYGSIQVRGTYVDYDLESGMAGNSLTANEANGGLTADTDDHAAWNDMRLRIGGDIAVAEGVSVHFRFDANESNENSSDPAAWGSTGPQSAYRYTNRRSDIQFDKAYLQLEKNGFTLLAGEMYFGGFGYTYAIHDSTAAGFIVRYGDFQISHSKNSEENLGNETLQINPLEGDSSTTAAKYVFKGDGFSLTPMVAYTADGTVYNQDVFAVALAGSVKLGPVDLKGEVDYFDGDQDYTFGSDLTGPKSAVDTITGLQAYLDASMMVTDTVKLGLQGLYADSVDMDDEKQMTSLTTDFRTDWAFVDFNPQSLGAGDFAYADNFDIFDPSKFYGHSGNGVIAGGLYANVKVNDKLSLDFLGMAFETEDDQIINVDGYFLNAKATYKLMENTTFTNHLNYMSTTVEDKVGSESDLDNDAFGIISSLAVSF